MNISDVFRDKSREIIRQQVFGPALTFAILSVTFSTCQINSGAFLGVAEKEKANFGTVRFDQRRLKIDLVFDLRRGAFVFGRQSQRRSVRGNSMRRLVGWKTFRDFVQFERRVRVEPRTNVGHFVTNLVPQPENGHTNFLGRRGRPRVHFGYGRIVRRGR